MKSKLIIYLAVAALITPFFVSADPRAIKSSDLPTNRQDLVRYSVPPGFDPILDTYNAYSLAKNANALVTSAIKNINSTMIQAIKHQVPIPPGIDPIADVYNITNLTKSLTKLLINPFSIFSGGSSKVKLPDVSCTVLNRDLYAGDGWVVNSKGQYETVKGPYYNELLALQAFLAFSDQRYLNYKHIEGYWGSDHNGELSDTSEALLAFEKDYNLPAVRLNDARGTLTLDWNTREKIRQLSCEDKKHPQGASVSGPSFLHIGETGTWTVSAQPANDKPLSYGVVWGDEPDASPLGLVSSTTSHTISFQTSSTFSHTYVTSGTQHVTFYIKGSDGKMSYRSVFVSVPGLAFIDPAANGSVWTAATTKTVSWFSTGLSKNATLALTAVDSGTQSVAKTFSSNIPETATNTIISLSGLSTGDYVLRLADNNDSKLSDSRTFKVANTTAPNCQGTKAISNTAVQAATFAPGNNLHVTWNATCVDKVLIILTKLTAAGGMDGTPTWVAQNPAAANPGAQGSYDWTIPATMAAGTYKIQIFNYDPASGGNFAGTIIGNSNNFTIQTSTNNQNQSVTCGAGQTLVNGVCQNNQSANQDQTNIQNTPQDPLSLAYITSSLTNNTGTVGSPMQFVSALKNNGSSAIQNIVAIWSINPNGQNQVVKSSVIPSLPADNTYHFGTDLSQATDLFTSSLPAGSYTLRFEVKAPSMSATSSVETPIAVSPVSVKPSLTQVASILAAIQALLQAK